MADGKQVRRFTVRRANDEEREPILRLVSEMHGPGMRERLAWFYADNPHGRAVSWVAVDEASGRLVGAASLFPRDALVNGRPIRGCMGADCFVAKEARRQGLATRLHRATREELTALGLEFVYGPAVKENLHALLKAGAREVTALRQFVRPLNARFFSDYLERSLPQSLSAATFGLTPRALGGMASFVYRLTRRSLTPGFEAEPVESFGPEWDEWYRANAPSTGVFLARDSAYLDYWYGAARPEGVVPYVVRSGGVLQGMFVLRFKAGVSMGDLVDFLARFDIDSMRMGLRLAIRRAAERGCSALRVTSMPHALFTRALSAEGFLDRSGEEPLVFPLMVPVDGRPRAELFQGEAWYCLGADLRRLLA